MTTPAKRPRGGQPLPPGERKDRMLTIRIRDEDHEQLRAWAGDRPLGPLLVETGLRAAKRAA